MRVGSPSWNALRRVAIALKEHSSTMVFLGGAAVPILVTDDAAAPERPTKDVDILVEVSSLVEYYAIVARLIRYHGFRHDTSEGAPTCRLIVANDRVDLMPTEPGILGFSGRWIAHAHSSAFDYALDELVTIRVARAPELLATKAEAFSDRGENDFVASHDLEDFIAVVDGRPELAEELATTGAEIRMYLRETVSRWLALNDFVDALPGHLAGDQASQDRVSILLDRLEQIAR